MLHLFTFLVNSIIFLVKLQLKTRLTRNYIHTIYYLQVLFTFIVLMFGSECSAQNINTPRDTGRHIEAYLDSSWNYSYVNLDSVKYYNEQAFALSSKFNDKRLRANNLAYIGIYFELTGDYDSAVYYHLEGIRLLESEDTLRQGLADAYHNLSNCYNNFNYLQRALEANAKSYELANEYNLEESISYSLFNRGNLHIAVSNHTKAIESFKSVIARLPPDTVDELIYSSYANIGKMYLKLELLDSAKKYFDLYHDLVIQNPENGAFDLMNIARNLHEYNIEAGNLKESKAYLDTSFKYSKQIESLEDIAICLEQYSIYFEKIGKPDSALHYYRNYQNLLDSLEGAEVKGRIIEIETKYETAKKENKILELEGEAKVTKARNTFMNVVSALLGLIVIIILIFFNINRQKSKKLAEQNQIIQESYVEIENLIRESHHRIKNNLQVVSSLLKMQSKSVQSEEAKASLVEAFNRVKTIALLHQKLQGSQTFKRIRLNDFVQQLIDNIKASITDKSKGHQIITQVEPIEVDTDQSISIGLIVNELVTNSIKYAFSQDDGQVKVQLTSTDSRLRLKVTDNGPGLPMDFDPESTKSLGFKIIKSLVTKLHGELTVMNENGAVIQIDIPYKPLLPLQNHNA